MTDVATKQLEADDPFWTDDPLADMLIGVLDQLVAANVVQTRDLDDDSEEFRWNTLYAGSWEQSLDKD